MLTLIHPPLFRQLQRISLATFILALLFNIFFEVTKHLPALVDVSVFIQDPFDAVGSFGVQLAFLASLFSVVRILRPYPKGIKLESLWLISYGDMLSLLSIGVTLTADLIAIVRLHYRWLGMPAGWVLVGLTCGLTGLTCLVGWRLLHLSNTLGIPRGESFQPRSLFVYLAGFVLLAFYPEEWEWTLPIPMGLVAALLGSLLLFAWCAETVRLIYSQVSGPPEDFLDDLFAIYTWVKTHAGPATFMFQKTESAVKTVLSIPWISRLAAWLNPRRYAWHIGLIAALGMGILLSISEVMDHGIPRLRFIFLVFPIFISIEGMGVVIGFALFRSYLGIFRKT